MGEPVPHRSPPSVPVALDSKDMIPSEALILHRNLLAGNIITIRIRANTVGGVTKDDWRRYCAYLQNCARDSDAVPIWSEVGWPEFKFFFTGFDRSTSQVSQIVAAEMHEILSECGAPISSVWNSQLQNTKRSNPADLKFWLFDTLCLIHICSYFPNRITSVKAVANSVSPAPSSAYGLISRLMEARASDAVSELIRLVIAGGPSVLPPPRLSSSSGLSSTPIDSSTGFEMTCGTDVLNGPYFLPFRGSDLISLAVGHKMPHVLSVLVLEGVPYVEFEGYRRNRDSPHIIELWSFITRSSNRAMQQLQQYRNERDALVISTLIDVLPGVLFPIIASYGMKPSPPPLPLSRVASRVDTGDHDPPEEGGGGGGGDEVQIDGSDDDAGGGLFELDGADGAEEEEDNEMERDGLDFQSGDQF